MTPARNTGGPVRQNLRLDTAGDRPGIDFSAFKFTVLHDWSLETKIDFRISNESQQLSGKFLISYRFGRINKNERLNDNINNLYKNLLFPSQPSLA